MMKREDVHAMLQRILDRLQARKELAIAKVVPKLVGVEDVAEAEEILKELPDEMLEEIDDIERELGLTEAGPLHRLVKRRGVR